MSGSSVIDWHRLNLQSPAAARRFLENHELNLDVPGDRTFIEHVKKDAVSYLRRHFKFAIPKPVEAAGIEELMLLASSSGHRQLCACTILKTVQIINHMAGRVRAGQVEPMPVDDGAAAQNEAQRLYVMQREILDALQAS